MNSPTRVAHAAARPPRSPGVLPALYLPFVRRVLLRCTLTWFALRMVLEGFAAKAGDGGLSPAPALGVIGFVLVIERLHERAVREALFRANAGIGAGLLYGSLAGLLLALELLFRLGR